MAKTKKLTKCQQEKLRKKFSKLRDQLVEQLYSGRLENLDCSHGDEVDIASNGEIIESAARALEARSSQLVDLERAMDKLEKGTYGQCEICGEPIGKSRLSVLPFADLCLGCQEDEENCMSPRRNKVPRFRFRDDDNYGDDGISLDKASR